MARGENAEAGCSALVCGPNPRGTPGVTVMHTTALPLSVVSLIVLACVPAGAQQINGVPGSPSATQTIDGKQLPPPPLPFGGVIKQDAKDSKPWWPPTVVPPRGAPNVLLIITDDSGYGVPSTFGGVIPTPALD